MTKVISNEIYKHKGYLVTRMKQGICVENHLELFATFSDARRFIDKILDGTHDKEPVVIGIWSEEKE